VQQQYAREHAAGGVLDETVDALTKNLRHEYQYMRDRVSTRMRESIDDGVLKDVAKKTYDDEVANLREDYPVHESEVLCTALIRYSPHDLVMQIDDSSDYRDVQLSYFQQEQCSDEYGEPCDRELYRPATDCYTRNVESMLARRDEMVDSGMDERAASGACQDYLVRAAETLRANKATLLEHYNECF
jgi:hypothetical protein